MTTQILFHFLSHYEEATFLSGKWEKGKFSTNLLPYYFLREKKAIYLLERFRKEEMKVLLTLLAVTMGEVVTLRDNDWTQIKQVFLFPFYFSSDDEDV